MRVIGRWIGVLLALGVQPALAVNKCVGGDGSVTYTDGPCAGGSAVTRIETPPPPSRLDQAEAQRRGEQMVDEARALTSRQRAEALMRQRRREADQAAEAAAQQRQARQEALREESERLIVVRPVVPRYWPQPQPVVPRPKPVEPERPQPATMYPRFR